MKSDKERRLKYVRSQREILQRTEEELQKQIDAEKREFDFRSKMPVGSVWLDYNKVVGHFDNATGFIRKNDPIIQVMPNYSPLSTYHAHKIVKAAQHYIESQGDGWHDLNDAVEAAEQDGVLQNLE